MLLEVFIIQKGTSFLLLRRSFTNKEFRIDGGLFSGLITAISQFIFEFDFGEIKYLETGKHRILILPNESIMVVGIIEEEREDLFVKSSLKKIKEEFWNEFGILLSVWNGNTSVFQKFLPKLDDIVYSEFVNYFLTKNFPKNIISTVRKFQQKFPPDVLRLIGRKTGQERGQTGLTIKNFRKELTKELNLFSITKISSWKDEEIIITIYICPICRGIRDPTFSCEFITGFIQGYAEINYPNSNIIVEETNCKAKMDQNCEFSLIVHPKV